MCSSQFSSLQLQLVDFSKPRTKLFISFTPKGLTTEICSRTVLQCIHITFVKRNHNDMTIFFFTCASEHLKFLENPLFCGSVQINRPLSSYASVPANNNLKSGPRARKYSKYMKTWHEASTSGYCSQELKRNSKVVFSLGRPVAFSNIYVAVYNYRSGSPNDTI